MFSVQPLSSILCYVSRVFYSIRNIYIRFVLAKDVSFLCIALRGRRPVPSELLQRSPFNTVLRLSPGPFSVCTKHSHLSALGWRTKQGGRVLISVRNNDRYRQHET